MKKIPLGIILGICAGVIDVVPMILQKLTWDANLSAFTFWVIVGLFIALVDIKLKGALKGIFVSLLLMMPLAIIIAWQEPVSLLPIVLMNLLLGSLLGWLIQKYKKKIKIIFL